MDAFSTSFQIKFCGSARAFSLLCPNEKIGGRFFSRKTSVKSINRNKKADAKFEKKMNLKNDVASTEEISPTGWKFLVEVGT
jgi:hypothetical protein